jgi:FtsP/CotA-like multicopper oxidase with cupredoxin domain
MSRHPCRRLSRRDLLRLGAGLGGSVIFGCGGGRGNPDPAAGAGRSAAPPTPIRFGPFSRELPTPANGGIRVLKPGPAFATACRFAAGVKPSFYELTMKKAYVEIIPGVQTEIWGYDGEYPGPAILGRMGTPDVVRQVNHLDVETSVHQHGGHNPSDSDGLPMRDQLIHPGDFKDYCYPNAPVTGADGNPDPNENPSTLWYHDHATDITGPNVYRGLAGFYLVTDDLEQGLIDGGVLPGLKSNGTGSDLDVPLVLQDRRFNRDGSLFYDPFDHDGFLGDVLVANGKAQPYLRVQRRKYRLRILNGANARFLMLRLSSGARLLQIGADSWLLPSAIARDRILLGGAERADVVVDFRDAPAEVFLEDILEQDDGRGPDGDLEDPKLRARGVPFVKFIVEGPAVPNDAACDHGTRLRPHTAILADEIVRTRRWRFDRGQGAWQVNGQFYDEDRPDATVELGTAERWIFENGGGGWWHPVHIHLASHQVESFNGRPPAIHNAFKKDTTLLGPGDEAAVLVRFADYDGRFVVHCHNVEHEDDRMMVRYDVARKP